MNKHNKNPLISAMKPPSVEEIKALIFQLSLKEQEKLLSELEEQIQSMAMMQLAETGFEEWNDPEEDIYKLEVNKTTFPKL